MREKRKEGVESPQSDKSQERKGHSLRGSNESPVLKGKDGSSWTDGKSRQDRRQGNLNGKADGVERNPVIPGTGKRTDEQYLEYQVREGETYRYVIPTESSSFRHRPRQ